jgi:hypothetical protein
MACVCQNPHCSKPFTIKPCEKKRGDGVYCSRLCRDWRTEKERFWSFVHKTEACWLWTGAKGEKGHGHFRLKKSKEIGAHVYSYQLAYGPVPPGLCVLHNCPLKDNPSCVNPSHLFLGTKADNMYDRRNKGGYPQGEDCPSAKLNNEKAARIRVLAATMSHTELAIMFRVTRPAISAVINRKTYRHLA